MCKNCAVNVSIANIYICNAHTGKCKYTCRSIFREFDYSCQKGFLLLLDCGLIPFLCFRPKSQRRSKNVCKWEFSGGEAATWVYQFLSSWAEGRKKLRDEFMGEPTVLTLSFISVGSISPWGWSFKSQGLSLRIPQLTLTSCSHTVELVSCMLAMQQCPFSPNPWARWYGWLAQCLHGGLLGAPLFGSSFGLGSCLLLQVHDPLHGPSRTRCLQACRLSLPCDSGEYSLTQKKKEKTPMTRGKEILLMVGMQGPEKVKSNVHGYLPASNL